MGTIRKLRVRFFYLAAALSMLLLLITLFLWPMSYSRTVTAAYVTARKTEVSISVDSGRATLEIRIESGRFRTGFSFENASRNYDNYWRYLSWEQAQRGNDTTLGITRQFSILDGLGSASLAVPLSYLSVLLAILPLLALRLFRRRRIARVGYCPKCAYDLRVHLAANASQLRPESGAVVSPLPVSMASRYRIAVATLRKLPRRIFYTLSAVSTLLLLASLFFWPASYFGLQLGFSFSTPKTGYYFLAAAGRMMVQQEYQLRNFPESGLIVYYDPQSRGWPSWSYFTWNTPEDPKSTFDSYRGYLGVGRRHFPDQTFTLVPFPYFTIPFAVLPLLAVRSIRRRRKLARVARLNLLAESVKNPHACIGAAPGVVCPECGTPIASLIAAPSPKLPRPIKLPRRRTTLIAAVLGLLVLASIHCITYVLFAEQTMPTRSLTRLSAYPRVPNDKIFIVVQTHTWSALSDLQKASLTAYLLRHTPVIYHSISEVPDALVDYEPLTERLRLLYERSIASGRYSLDSDFVEMMQRALVSGQVMRGLKDGFQVSWQLERSGLFWMTTSAWDGAQTTEDDFIWILYRWVRVRNRYAIIY